MQKISSSAFTYIFLAIASLLFLGTGILGAITIANIYSFGFEVLISDSYSQAVFSFFAALSIVSVYATRIKRTRLANSLLLLVFRLFFR